MSEADFARLPTAQKGGFIKRSDFGRFIAENLLRDPKSKVLELNAAQLLVGDFGVLVQTIGRTLGTILAGPDDDAAAARRTAEEKLTKLLGEDNLVGSSGEFGMFLDMTLPTGWQSWKKRRLDWTVHTTGLLLSAAKEYHAQKRNAS